MTDVQRIELIRASISRIQVQRLSLYETLDTLLEQFEGTFEAEDQAVITRDQVRQQIEATRNTLTALESEENRYKQTLESLRAIIEMEPEEEPIEEPVDDGEPDDEGGEGVTEDEEVPVE